MPRPATFLLQPPRVLAFLLSFPAKVDDDAAVKVAGRFVVNPKRNLGDYDRPVYGFNGTLYVGEWFEVFTYDGWGGWTNHPWSLQLYYDNGESLALQGGEERASTAHNDLGGLSGNFVGTPGGVHDPATYEQYHPNGAFRIPPPPSWPCATVLNFENTYCLAAPESAVPR